jgi:tripartite-type tricarboxylate transporter receptor subunit TctC
LKELGIDASLPMIVGLGVPKNTPGPIVERLRAVVKQVCMDKAFISVIESQGDEVQCVDGDDFSKILEKESKKVSTLFKQLLAEKQ